MFKPILVCLLVALPIASAQTVLPGTAPLTFTGDPAARMVDSIHTYLDTETKSAKHTGPIDRERLKTILGAVDPRVPFTALKLEATTSEPAEVGRGKGYKVYAVRWPVFADVDAEGLFIQPDGPPKARIVAIPDADESPEMLLARIGYRFGASGCEVLIPVLIDRKDTWSGIPGVKMTTQTHREWIYRMAFEAGRHIIGYEVQKALAAVDGFDHENQAQKVPIAVAGWGEGGLLALYATSLDPRINATLVNGYTPTIEVWREPIYHDVWGLLREFTPPQTAIHQQPEALLGALGVKAMPASESPAELRKNFDPSVRLHRQFDQLVAHTQALIRKSPANREAFWAKADRSSLPAWKTSTQPIREYIWTEVIGRLPNPNVPANPRTRQIYDEPKYRGYEVMLDVWPGVFAYGILLVPKDIRPGERRPVVVCQHGLEGRSSEVTDAKVDSHYYHHYAATLAEQGFITFAPQNPYIGQDHFRQIQRKGHPLKLSLFSFILGQHQRILEWLGDQPFVDRTRIGFYGLSYGGKTAVRVPPLLDGYALSICSADFNEWVWKTTSVESRYSYMVTPEYDMLEFNFANVLNYSDLASLMAPRPFMVERGHEDGVAPDEWVAYEYAKVKRFYDKMGIGDRTAIEFFDGPHTIHGVGTFEFLRRYLK